MDFFLKKWVKDNSDSVSRYAASLLMNRACVSAAFCNVPAAIPFVVSRFLDSRRGRVTVLVVLVGGGAGLFKYWKAVKRSRKQAEREFVKEAGSMFPLCALPR